MGKKVVTFGEIMLRLATPGHMRFVQSDSFTATYGGAEANVAASLASFGYDACFITRLPENELGRSALNYLRRFAIKTDYIILGGGRIGIYFLETGASQRPSRVIYDRAGSSAAEIEPGTIDWESIFADAVLFHFTGITPAISDTSAEVCLEAVKAAQKLGVKISCDLNYRRKLWATQKAAKVMGELVSYADIVIANEEDADKVFGIKAPETDVRSGQLDREKYKFVAQELARRFKLKTVAVTLRESISASENNWSGLLYDGDEFYFSRRYMINIVDRVGSGDAFAAGLIYGLLEGKAPQETVEFASAASCLAHSVSGDFNITSPEEIEALVKGDASGRVQR